MIGVDRLGLWLESHLEWSQLGQTATADGPWLGSAQHKPHIIPLLAGSLYNTGIEDQSHFALLPYRVADHLHVVARLPHRPRHLVDQLYLRIAIIRSIEGDVD